MCTLPANDWPSSWPHDPHQSNKEADNSSGTIQWRGCFGWFRKKAGTWQRWRDKRAWQEDKGETRTQQRLVHVDGAKIQVVNCAIEIDLRLKSMLMRFFFQKFGMVVQPLCAACAAMQQLDVAGRFESSRDLSAVPPVTFVRYLCALVRWWGCEDVPGVKPAELLPLNQSNRRDDSDKREKQPYQTRSLVPTRGTYVIAPSLCCQQSVPHHHHPTSPPHTKPHVHIIWRSNGAKTVSVWW